MSNLDSFRAALVGGGARKNQFRVSLTFPQIVNGGSTVVPIATAQFFCFAANIPGSKVKTTSVHYRGRELKLPSEREFEPYKVSIINDTNFAHHSAFNIWSDLINSVKDNTGITNPVSYTADIYLDALDRNGAVISTYKMQGAWPTDVGQIELDFKDEEIQTFDVTFEYLYWQSTTIGQV